MKRNDLYLSSDMGSILMSVPRDFRVFDLGDVVWFCPNQKPFHLYKGVITGVQYIGLDAIEGPSEQRQYTIKIEDVTKPIVTDCSTVFFTEEEAKQSAIYHVQRCYDHDMKEIEDFFKDRKDTPYWAIPPKYIKA